MPRSLLITVRFHECRYHGQGDGFSESDGWPPSPARLFQALVAAAARGAQLRSEDRQALMWLEQLDPPEIAAPAVRRGRAVKVFVPNNDLDSKEGDPARVSETRVEKRWRPCFFDSQEPVLYVWDFEAGPAEAEASRICSIAERLYQLGRGIDIAWAEGQILDRNNVKVILESHPTILRKPRKSGSTAVPHPGTLDSLILRYQRKRERLTTVLEGRKSYQLFTQPPKASFSHAGYEAPPRQLHFELRLPSGGFAPRPLATSASLVTGLRNLAADRLSDALPDKAALFERIIIGRGAGPADLDQRIRLIPIPSIGTMHTDPSVRRIMVEVPANCPIRLDDLRWAFTGIQPFDPGTGEIWSGSLVSTDDSRMADRFAQSGRVFRSITPVALPIASRRYLEGSRPQKRGEERVQEEWQAAGALVQALRHTGIRARPTDILVRKEPLHRRGVRAEKFADGSRFSKHVLWHAELRFSELIPGPLVVGNGRFCGLGLLEPVSQHIDVVSFDFRGAQPIAPEDRGAFIGYLRRALMALSRDESGRVGRLFSGHEPDGRSDSAGHHAHVFLTADSINGDGWIDRLIVAAPWACDHRSKANPKNRHLFEEVVRNLSVLRAGRFGRFDNLIWEPVQEGDPILGPAKVWIGRTPYRATRNFRKRDEPVAVVKADVVAECVRRGLPVPTEIEVLSVTAGPRGGQPTAQLKIRFAIAVRGPLLLGRDSHAGGGLFHALK